MTNVPAFVQLAGLAALTGPQDHVVQTTALLKKKPKPTDQDIDEAMTNICRCGTYQRIRAAVHQAAGTTTRGAAASGNSRT